MTTMSSSVVRPGDVYLSSGAVPHKCVIVWSHGHAYGSVPMTARMERLVERFGPKALFLLVFRYQLVKAFRRVRAELTYSQW